jgi:hypothetical protein
LDPRNCLHVPTAFFDGWEDRIGAVEKGKLADLIVVDGDPLAEIKVLTETVRIALVIKDGAIAADREPIALVIKDGAIAADREPRPHLRPVKMMPATKAITDAPTQLPLRP